MWRYSLALPQYIFPALSTNLPKNKIKSSVKSFRYSRPNRPATHPVGQGLRAILTFRGDRLRSALSFVGFLGVGRGEIGEGESEGPSRERCIYPSIHPSIGQKTRVHGLLTPLHCNASWRRSKHANRCMSLCEHCFLYGSARDCSLFWLVKLTYSIECHLIS